MTLNQNAAANRVSAFGRDLDRAIQLYQRIAESGSSRVRRGRATPPRRTDSRNAAPSIFFEAAAEFEAFAQDLS